MQSILATIVGSIIGIIIGYTTGVNEIIHRDHIQAKAGIFIDGYDKNKVYDLKVRNKD